MFDWHAFCVGLWYISRVDIIQVVLAHVSIPVRRQDNAGLGDQTQVVDQVVVLLIAILQEVTVAKVVITYIILHLQQGTNTLNWKNTLAASSHGNQIFMAAVKYGFNQSGSIVLKPNTKMLILTWFIYYKYVTTKSSTQIWRFPSRAAIRLCLFLYFKSSVTR